MTTEASTCCGLTKRRAHIFRRAHSKPGADRNSLFVFLMLIGLSLVTVGNGFFKPNISTMVGSLTQRATAAAMPGFTIFYMGINLGSFFSQLLCPFLADNVGWWAGFGLAAGGMLLAAALFQFDGGRLDGYGERPEGADPSRDWSSTAAQFLPCLSSISSSPT